MIEKQYLTYRNAVSLRDSIGHPRECIAPYRLCLIALIVERQTGWTPAGQVSFDGVLRRRWSMVSQHRQTRMRGVRMSGVRTVRPQMWTTMIDGMRNDRRLFGLVVAPIAWAVHRGWVVVRDVGWDDFGLGCWWFAKRTCWSVVPERMSGIWYLDSSGGGWLLANGSREEELWGKVWHGIGIVVMMMMVMDMFVAGRVRGQRAFAHCIVSGCEWILNDWLIEAGRFG